MTRSANRIALGAILAGLVAGCAMDVPRMMLKDENLKTRVLGAIAADSVLAGRMVQQLLAAEDTREELVDAAMANGDAARSVMVKIAGDPTRLDAVLGLAVQDSTTKQHVLTLLKGMQMAGAK